MKKLLITLTVFLSFVSGSPQEKPNLPIPKMEVIPASPDPVLKLEQLYQRMDSAKTLMNEKDT